MRRRLCELQHSYFVIRIPQTVVLFVIRTLLSISYGFKLYDLRIRIRMLKKGGYELRNMLQGARACANSLPGRRIKLKQKLFLFFHEREIVVHVGAKCIRSTRCGPTAHKIVRVVVVPESDRMV